MHGFALAYSPCDEIDAYPFAGNTVGSAAAGFIFTKVAGSCMSASGIKAYACGICQITSSSGTKELSFKNFIMADCGRAVTLRFGLGGRKNSDMTAYFSDSFITAISRPECSECYGSGAIDCTDNQAVRMLAVTVNGEALPDKFGTGYDVICKEETFDCKAFLNGITFENYNQQYG